MNFCNSTDAVRCCSHLQIKNLMRGSSSANKDEPGKQASDHILAGLSGNYSGPIYHPKPPFPCMCAPAFCLVLLLLESGLSCLCLAKSAPVSCDHRILSLPMTNWSLFLHKKKTLLAGGCSPGPAIFVSSPAFSKGVTALEQLPLLLLLATGKQVFSDTSHTHTHTYFPGVGQAVGTGSFYGNVQEGFS